MSLEHYCIQSIVCIVCVIHSTWCESPYLDLALCNKILSQCTCTHTCTCKCVTDSCIYMYMFVYVHVNESEAVTVWCLADIIFIQLCSFVSVDYKFGVCVQQELNGEVRDDVL